VTVSEAPRLRCGPALLHKAQHGVDHQPSAHHGDIRVFSEYRRQNHDQFEHPRRDSPEFPQEFEDRVTFCYGYFVVAMLLAVRLHLRGSQPDVGVDMKGGQRVGTEAVAMSEGLPPTGFWGAADLFGPACLGTSSLALAP
jgi:hypothetical protein